VVTRFKTYDIRLEGEIARYAERILAMPEMIDWYKAAKREPESIDELEVEF
jgi:glutathione S-transferase